MFKNAPSVVGLLVLFYSQKMRFRFSSGSPYIEKDTAMLRLNSMRLIHLPKISVLLLLAFITLALSGCFLNDDGDDPAAVVDADPTGYYIHTGGNVQGGSVAVNDLQALVYDNRIMMISVAQKLFYDGTITNISGNSFTADFTIYERGGDINAAPPVTATATGAITTGSSITGTLNGSGVGSGIFTLLYDATASNTVAALSRVENVAGVNTSWEGKTGGSFATQEFFIDSLGVLTEVDFTGGGVFSSCELDGNITPISNNSLYSVSVELTECGSSTRNGTYTGLATSRTDSTDDDTLVLAVSNGLYGMAGDFK